ncbi:hypothetical protein B0H19DRAFT_1274660 [Mycena capillaripes]|nr:hypothetical protein B0H19DRAFT_1274660 [Mycena capillaripes]
MPCGSPHSPPQHGVLEYSVRYQFHIQSLASNSSSLKQLELTKTTNAASSSSSPTSTCLSTGALCGGAPPGTLYLFTFLATLLLLSLVAGGIVSRSVYLRRRERHLIATGQWGSPLRARPTTELPNLKKKPQIFDAYLNLNLGGGILPESELLKQWEWMMPFSATCAEFEAERGIPSPPAPEPAYQTAAQLNNLVAPVVVSPVSHIFSRRRRVLRTTHPSTNTAVSPPSHPAEVAAMIPLSERQASRLKVDIAYIILMPATPRHNDNNAHPKIIQPDDEEEQFPLLEFGVSAVEVVRSLGDEEAFFEGDGDGDGKGVDSTPSP